MKNNFTFLIITFLSIIFSYNIAISQCSAGLLDASESPVLLCGAETFTMSTDGSETSTGGVGIICSPQTTGSGALGGIFLLSGGAFPSVLDSDLGGLLTDNNYPLFSGEWAFYSAAYSDANDPNMTVCDISADSIIINFKLDTDAECMASTSLDELDEINSWSISPNPTTGPVNISLVLNGTNDVLLNIFDLSGKLMTTKNAVNVNAINYNLDFSHLTNGIYLAKIKVGESWRTEKIIFNK